MNMECSERIGATLLNYSVRENSTRQIRAR